MSESLLGKFKPNDAVWIRSVSSPEYFWPSVVVEQTERSNHPIGSDGYLFPYLARLIGRAGGGRQRVWEILDFGEHYKELRCRSEFSSSDECSRFEQALAECERIVGITRSQTRRKGSGKALPHTAAITAAITYDSKVLNEDDADELDGADKLDDDDQFDNGYLTYAPESEILRR